MKTEKILVFSSGAGYGKSPIIDGRYQIICLRGPLTAKILNVDPSYAVSDGALLLSKMKLPAYAKKYPCAFMPHHQSEQMYHHWQKICLEAGIHYISPHSPPKKVIKEIQQSEKLISEAMHGAIVADLFRVPWIPVRAYRYINEFKWKDWGLSVNLEVKLKPIHTLLDNHKILEIASANYPTLWQKPIKEGYQFYKRIEGSIAKKHVIRELKKLMNGPAFLSKRIQLERRTDQLMNHIEHVKTGYLKKSY